MMKNIIIALCISNLAAAQIALGGKTTVDGSGILDFPAGTTKGIILPYVTNSNAMTNVTPGTLVFDLTSSKVKYNDGFWKDLTDKQGSSPMLEAGTDQPNAKVIFGSQTSAADGVLILEAADKALILPQIINPAKNVKSPAAGMMAYDPDKKMMCIYNGKEWFFWK
ncbi:hypothetical protein L0B70_07095 [Kaistella sp. 97-N-M2]|uniref:hypothetical protein n=1 Tax=Kaistella sp. 97-N-M2 TaxID=2908645 RepID=UPI001F33292C|nr:hypothetical protein [Kaistella sp. 97-N-M2]UJF28643.1 hypothetical protein L0B70_07095 [Kaistella sp. 97-N-M2]